MADEENLEIEDEGDAKPVETKRKIGLSPLIVKILIGVAAILIVGLISGGIAFLVSRSVGRATGVQGGIADDMVKSAPPTYYVITPEFNVNTADLDVARYVRVNIVLAYRTNVKQLSAELPERAYVMKDRITTILSSYTYNTLRTNDGREQLKQDIKREINSMLRNGQIDDVLFDSFLLS